MLALSYVANHDHTRIRVAIKTDRKLTLNSEKNEAY